MLFFETNQGLKLFKTKEIHNLREQKLENYSKKKKELDDQLHLLEQKKDQIRGQYQLNSEKLSYFYNVLMERVEENENAKKV